MRSKIAATLIKITMFVSSYAPLYIMLLILYWDKCASIFDARRMHTIDSVILVTVLGSGILISCLSLFLLKMSKSSRNIKYGKILRPDDVIISYIMTYIIPLLSSGASGNATMAVNFILFLIIGYLYIRLNLIYLNPLWAMFGYITFRTDSDEIIITNIKFDTLRKRDNVKGSYLINGVFFARAKDNHEILGATNKKLHE